MPSSADERGEDVVAAGVRVLTNCRPSMTPDAIEPDCECSLIVGVQPPPDGSWVELLEVGIFLRKDGRAAVITAAGNSSEALGVQIRSIAPFAAALQGRITLHASCVSTGDRACGFIGASGVGKSTFARHLAAHGCQVICDDLLAIRLVEDRWIVPTRTGNLSLAGLYFVGRGAGDSRLCISRLMPKDALLAHIKNGFGEMRNSAVWEAQFKAYSVLSKSVPSYLLEVPDDLSRLPLNTAIWLELATEDR